MKHAFATMLVVCSLLLSSLNAAEWPAFRGPGGDGTTSAQNVPTQWGPEQNILWKTKLPQPGNSSPIVCNGRVFLSCAQDQEGKRRSLYCFDAQTGKELWVRTVQFDQVMPTHQTNPYCASTPVTDGHRVVVWHGSAGLYCYDYDGQPLWSADLGEVRHMWGYASSPIIYRDRVILKRGPGKNLALMALDLANGKQLWLTEEPVAGDGEHRPDKWYVGSWSTPIIAQVDGQDQIICSLPTRVAGYDPNDGRMLWFCEGLSGPRGDLAYSCPMVQGDICVVLGGFHGPALGVRLGGSGNVTETHRLWLKEARNPQNIGSGVFLDEHIYIAHAGPGTIECLHAPTGKTVWTGRGGANHWSSVIYAGGLLYAINQQGTTAVFKPNPERYKEVAVNELNESSNSTPAPVDGRLFIRTFEHLYCVHTDKQHTE